MKQKPVLSQEAQNVLASMAIENMYFDDEFLRKIEAIEKGELSTEDVRKELLQTYGKNNTERDPV